MGEKKWGRKGKKEETEKICKKKGARCQNWKEKTKRRREMRRERRGGVVS